MSKPLIAARALAFLLLLTATGAWAETAIGMGNERICRHACRTLDGGVPNNHTACLQRARDEFDACRAANC